MNAKITVNGRKYDSLDQMPESDRKAYEQAMSVLADRDGNGVPDVLEGGSTRIDTSSSRGVVTSVVTKSRFVVNGQEYQRWEDVPPAMRAMLKVAGVGNDTNIMTSSSPSSTSPVRAFRNDTGAGGITIRITWSTILALLAAIGVAMIVAWAMM
jgi:hypothetical protein